MGLVEWWRETAERNEARQADRGITPESMTRKTLVAIVGVIVLLLLAAAAQYLMHGQG